MLSYATQVSIPDYVIIINFNLLLPLTKFKSMKIWNRPKFNSWFRRLTHDIIRTTVCVGFIGGVEAPIQWRYFCVYDAQWTINSLHQSLLLHCHQCPPPFLPFPSLSPFTTTLGFRLSIYLPLLFHPNHLSPFPQK